MNSDHYTYRVRWSAEDAAFIGTVAELSSLSWVADKQDEAFVGIRELVASVLEDMTENGETAPDAIADRTYSGKFMVRLTPEAHRQLALDAAEQHVSLNRLAANRLAGA
ncbi:type II toxin-antitoxin system HicB family antitoxin [Psychromicrobium xiongbiense]|uniref:type II toxin-antitoxin system HicB family antitoxin n=1 Tax=Psychromicrobium xiongbiense TaxID=3051184 RepID=UPI00255266C2|nr:toxin-antitoxin system HicB family antitoxin [Psychromicrobium sp. YIM S02556]